MDWLHTFICSTGTISNYNVCILSVELISRRFNVLSPCYVLTCQICRKHMQKIHAKWIAFSVWGFRDSPVSWCKHEHGHFVSGENDYTFVLWPDKMYLLYQALGTHDNYS
jgi:hypothetical protein